jgi:hypothetical protein
MRNNFVNAVLDSAATRQILAESGDGRSEVGWQGLLMNVVQIRLDLQPLVAYRSKIDEI